MAFDLIKEKYIDKSAENSGATIIDVELIDTLSICYLAAIKCRFPFFVHDLRRFVI